MLLHGDLHHYNVRFDRDHGWNAIDPKGVVGEFEYEVGALLRNPIKQPEIFTDPATIERRIKILSPAPNSSLACYRVGLRSSRSLSNVGPLKTATELKRTIQRCN